MAYRLTSLIVVLAFMASLGCRSGEKNPSDNFKNQITPPISVENETLTMTARQVQVKGTSLRVWLTIENKTDEAFTLQYSDFSVTAGNAKLRGALRIPFKRISKAFEMPAGYYKEISQPIEFEGWAPAPSADVVLGNIPVNGEMTELTITIPTTN